MFEDYLEDASYYVELAKEAGDEKLAMRHYRSAVFHIGGSLEAFVNYVADSFRDGEAMQSYEIAFLCDKKFVMLNGAFQVTDQIEYHRIEDKLRFLLGRFVPKFEFGSTACWSQFTRFKEFRNALTHPRSEVEDFSLGEYEQNAISGLIAVIELMDELCFGMHTRRLRPKLLELKSKARSNRQVVRSN